MFISYSVGPTPIVLLLHPSSDQFFDNSAIHVKVADLRGYTHVRIHAYVGVGSASGNNPRLVAKYKLSSFSATVGDYSAIGTSEVSLSMTTGSTISSSGIIPLVAATSAETVFISVIQTGGNDLLSPSIASVMLEFLWMR